MSHPPHSHERKVWESRLDEVMQADQFRLRREWRRLGPAWRDGQSDDRRLERWRDQVTESIALRERRQASRPAVLYDPSLPVVERREAIAAAIRDHQVVIVCGETGSGKSTQLPKICLELGRGIRGLIGHTQPRRIAARSVAERVAEELGSPLGTVVGFKVRFVDETRPETLIKVMTDGVLLAETQSDRFLDRYDTLIIDEAHERSLNIDFLLGYAKQLLPKRPDLRLIITSATIDAARFAEHFGNITAESPHPVPAPILEVSGRTYPVDIRYRPLQAVDSADDFEPDEDRHLANVVSEAIQDGPGDILVFLPTERDILAASHTLRGRFGSKLAIEILPLYARLSPAEQHRVFESHRQRRIVLATNVAESSLTVPGIRYVVDSGTARISRYSPRSQVQRLPIEAISQASANQRAGRCGRIGPGVCFRLFSAEDFESRDAYTTPEIRRANLAAVILQTKSLRLGRLEEFPFLDPPRTSAISDGYRALFELGAVDEAGELTKIGVELSQLPVDPRIGRMLVAAREEGCLRDMLVIAAALEVQDPRLRPVEKQQAADEAHARFAHPESDFLAWLNLWNFYHGLKQTLSRNQMRKACQQSFLSYHRMREWTDIHLQLKEMVGSRSIARTAGTADEPASAKYGRLHRALLTGLLSNIACRTEDNQYTAAGGNKVFLWPGSGPQATKPAWIMAAEVVETSRRFARCVARIDPAWIEPLAEHLIKRSYSEPHWSRKSGATMADEKLTLFGLTVVARRRVAYGRVDPVVSRELMIRDGLATGEFDSRAPFWSHNHQLIAEVESLGTKARRSDWFVDQYARYRFYNSRLPADVYDAARLEKWRKGVEREEPRRLFMQREDLLSGEEDVPSSETFPDVLEAQVTAASPVAVSSGRPATSSSPAAASSAIPLKLHYRFAPGEADDGVTATVPKVGLGHLTADQLDWLVPGLLEEKVLALIRSLPKQLRRNFVPAPDHAKRITRALIYGQGSLLVEVAKQLSRSSGERITPADFRTDSLPPHLRMNVRVVDDEGRTVRAGRDLAELRDACGVQEERRKTTSAATQVDPRWHRDKITTWDFGDCPEKMVISRGGISLPAYPGLVDAGDSVSLRVFDREDLARAATRGGVRRLVVLSESKSLKAHVDWLPDLPTLTLLASTLLPAATLRQQLIELIADLGYIGDRPLPRNADQFQQLLKRGREDCQLAVQDVAKWIGPLIRNYHELKLMLDNRRQAQFATAHADVTAQLDALLAEGFLLRTPWKWLQHAPRYLQAARLRLDKLAQNLAREQQSFASLQPLLRQLNEHLAIDPGSNAERDLYRWMLEELRVSLFAQQLGTSQPVSITRLEKQWAKVLASV